MGSSAERLLAAALRRLPAGRRDLGRALPAELAVVPPGRERAAWIAGGVWFVVKENVMHRVGYLLGLAIAAAVLVGVDRIGTSDDAGQVSMLVLLAAAALLGFVAPRLAWLAGLVIGAALAAAHTLYLFLGIAVGDPAARPGGYGGAALLLVLIVPATVAAYLGAGARWLLRAAARP